MGEKNSKRKTMVDVTGDCGPMLLEACKRGNLSFLKRIIDENKGKANLDAQDGLGNTALHYSAQGGHKQTLACLLDNKANPNVQNKVGDTPLHKAVGKDCRDCIRSLCEAGADANTKNKKNLTPLHMCKSQDVKTLIKKKWKSSTMMTCLPVTPNRFFFSKTNFAHN